MDCVRFGHKVRLKCKSVEGIAREHVHLKNLIWVLHKLAIQIVYMSSEGRAIDMAQ